MFEQILPPPGARIHMLGIGGAGVSGLARMLAGRGYQVTGSDMSASPTVDALRREGISVQIGHAAANVAGADLVVMTAAAKDDNPELVAARAADIPIVKRAALLGMLANPDQCIAVAGSHGKSTTSGMFALALERAGQQPSFAVGATVQALGTNARLGAGDLFVVEADEYDYSFLWLQPQVAIITSVEFDHPDLFPDFVAVLEAFKRFVALIRPGGALVCCADDAGVRQLLAQDDLLPAGVQVVTYGIHAGDWRLDPAAQTLTAPDGRELALQVGAPGLHNLLNATSVVASAESLGLDAAALLPGIAEFGGVSRRFEVLRETPGLTLVTDYAHHPTEVAATIAAARQRYAGRRIVAVFQPHTYTRTRALLAEFAQALDAADVIVLTGIYPARETDDLGVSSEQVAARMSAPVQVVDSPAAAAEAVHALIEEGDIVLVMGAGSIYICAEELLRLTAET